MLCLHHQARFLFATALGCLSAATLSAGFLSSAIGNLDEEGHKHRGSGRRASQELLLQHTAYRGTGRIYHERITQEHVPMAHRGSGRIDDDVTESLKPAYRGSGRVLPNELKLAKTA